MQCHHHSTRHHTRGVLAAVSIAVGLMACGGGESSAVGIASSDPSTETVVTKASRTSVSQPRSTEGRLLASNCFQCHGTFGTGGFESIRGSEANEVLEFMTKNASRDIMAAHAQGYTPAQLQKIIAYLQQ
ncbi:MAG: cytochrome c [Burkholderiaceae bacterium]|nr:cytochrome c [Burkholderiaceae bacterium]